MNQYKNISNILKEMKVSLGKDSTEKTWQRKFPDSTECCRCGGNAEIAFVAHEGQDKDDKPIYPRDFKQFVCDFHKNEGKGKLWPHDCIAVAVYFCRDCLETTALYNQG